MVRGQVLAPGRPRLRLQTKLRACQLVGNGLQTHGQAWRRDSGAKRHLCLSGYARGSWEAPLFSIFPSPFPSKLQADTQLQNGLI